MATIQPHALETHYAGCRFRSRLEARWAVFFDHLGVEWQYEPEGFSVGERLTLGGGRFPYLPDFWLPGLALWVEVKGSLTRQETVRQLDAAASLSSNDGGGCHDSGGYDLLMLGPVPPEGRGAVPVRLHMHKGDLIAVPWHGQVDRCIGSHYEGLPIARDVGGADIFDTGVSPEGAIDVLLNGLAGDPSARMRRAYTAARKARFEHGERG